MYLKRDALDRVARDKGWWKPRENALHQRNLAEAMRFTESYVSYVLDGHKPVSDGFAFRLMRVTGLSFEELFDAADEDEDTVRAAS